MAAIDNTQGTNILKAMLCLGTGITGLTATKIRLGSNAPTATVAMTEIAAGTGYIAGGSVIAWNTVVSMATTNSGAVTWTNTSTAWSIVGAELWDATPLRFFFGNWNGQPIAVATSNSFQVAAAGASVSLS
jgi:hypothetical protein